MKKNTRTIKGTKTCFKIYGEPNSTRMHIWATRASGSNGIDRDHKGKIIDTFNIHNIAAHKE